MPEQQSYTTCLFAVLMLSASSCTCSRDQHMHPDRVESSIILCLSSDRDVERLVGQRVTVDGITVIPTLGASYIRVGRGSLFVPLPAGFSGLRVRASGIIERISPTTPEPGVATYTGTRFGLDPNCTLGVLAQDGEVTAYFSSTDREANRSLLRGKKVTLEGVASYRGDCPILRIGQYQWWAIDLPVWPPELVACRLCVYGVVDEVSCTDTQVRRPRYGLRDCTWTLVE